MGYLVGLIVIIWIINLIVDNIGVILLIGGVLIAIACVFAIIKDKERRKAEEEHRILEEERRRLESEYRGLETEVLNKLGFSHWTITPHVDEEIVVKSRQALEKYDDVKYFKDDREAFARAEKTIKRKCNIARILKDWMDKGISSEMVEEGKHLGRRKNS